MPKRVILYKKNNNLTYLSIKIREKKRNRRSLRYLTFSNFYTCSHRSRSIHRIFNFNRP